MSHDYDSQPPLQADQSILLAKLRHELITPINIVVGYSSLLLEDWAKSPLEENLQLETSLKQVQAMGQQVFSVIKKIIPPNQSAEAVDLTELGSTLEAELSQPLNALMDCCQQLLSQGTADLAPDLAKINAAAQSLHPLIHELANRPAKITPLEHS